MSKIDIRIQNSPISFTENSSVPPDCGAMVIFTGIVRNHNDGKKVLHLFYEAYQTMAEKELRAIANEAVKSFDLSLVRIIHRIGKLEIGETAVLVEIMSPHRKEAFHAAEYCMDQIKVRVPIWKKEHYADGKTDWIRCAHVASSQRT